MTSPAERFNQNVWWILQEIKNEGFLTPKGEKVEFSVRVLQKNKDTDYSFPDIDTQRKLLNKLKEWGAIDDLEAVDDILRGGDVFNPKIYKLSIKQPKFNEVYDKVKKHFFPPKKVIPDEVIERLRIPPLTNEEDDILDDLYKEAVRFDKKDSLQTCKIWLGEVGDEQTEDRGKILANLKKRKIIMGYSTKWDTDEITTETGEVWAIDVVIANVKIIPQEIISYVKNVWSSKKVIVENLGRYYLDLIRVIEAYFRNPQKLDDELNRSYEILCEKVRILIFKNDISARLKYLFRRPFNSLFSAEKELEEKKITLKDKLNYLRDFYGQIQKLLLIYDISEEQGDEVIKIENYLNKIESQGKNVPETPSTKIEIQGLQEGLKAIAQSKKEDDKPRFPHKLPAGTKWEEFIIKFLDDEKVFIKVKQFKHIAGYKELGLVGKGNNPNPSELWAFLKVLSQVNGELTITDKEARDKYKKQKELLAKALQDYFLIDYDPFYPYRSSGEKTGNSYKIKLTLLPQNITKDNQEENQEEDNDELGIKEYLKEQAPQVNED
ncbi:MAG: hypothetical protein ABIG40_00865 [Parcubacteria group bacterium]